MTPSPDTADDVVVARRVGDVLAIAIDRPHRRNAIDRAVVDGLLAAYAELDGSDDLRAGVLTGTGGWFSAGMDLDAFAAGEWVGDEPVRRLPGKPLIAAIEGFALAGGLELALGCDLIVAARGARLGIPEVTRGLLAAGGGVIRLPRRLPRQTAMEMALTGEPLTSERAAELGLVNRLVEPGDALSSALELAASIAGNAPLAVRGALEMVRSSHDESESAAWERQAELVERIMGSEDAREGALAFAEKRPPVWRGR